MSIFFTFGFIRRAIFFLFASHFYSVSYFIFGCSMLVSRSGCFAFSAVVCLALLYDSCICICIWRWISEQRFDKRHTISFFFRLAFCRIFFLQNMNIKKKTKKCEQWIKKNCVLLYALLTSSLIFFSTVSTIEPERCEHIRAISEKQQKQQNFNKFGVMKVFFVVLLLLIRNYMRHTPQFWLLPICGCIVLHIFFRVFWIAHTYMKSNTFSWSHELYAKSLSSQLVVTS